jgi:Ca2+-binding RTX toxin-like protein
MSGRGGLRRGLARGLIVVAPAALLVTAAAAITATNSVPPTRLGQSAQPIGANTLKPGACAGITLTDLVTGSGIFVATDASELVLGSAGGDTITAGGGDDCALGGAAIDTIVGGAGTDVCIGGAGLDVFLTCETQIQ